MALHGYFGLPRSGKSYGVVEHVVIPSLQEGRHVITNIPLEGSTLVSVFGGQVTQLPPDWHEDPTFADTIPKGAVLILDEVWRKWPAGQSVNKVPKNELALCKEHGHRVDSNGKAMRIVLVTQDPSDLASWTRKLIAVSFRMEKLDAIGLNKTYRVDIYKGCPTGENPPKRLLVRSAKGTYKPEIYQYYRTATDADVGKVGDETVSDKRGSIWQSKWLWLCLVVGVTFPILGIWQIVDFFTPDTVQPEPQKALVNPMPTQAELVAIAPPVVQQSGPVVPDQSEMPPQSSEPGQPPLSQAWRVGGFVDLPDPDASQSPRAWSSVEGYNGHGKEPISRTTRVVLSGPYGRRFVDMDRCEFYPGGVDVFCDIDGERVTPWSGRGQMGGMVGDGLGQARDTVVARTQQSEGSATTVSTQASADSLSSQSDHLQQPAKAGIVTSGITNTRGNIQ